jgi:hypothetical protein
MKIIASILIWIGSLVIIGGWWSWIVFFITKRSSSLIPFLGSIFLISGVYLHPDKESWLILKPWIFAVLLIDLGTLSVIFKALQQNLWVNFGSGSFPSV